ncbi:MAG: CHAT domain-containing protein [Deltaproteobacteria bacterium]|nr:CHAT domain-containing protein [Deltaproteobacteria bacterium]
MIANKTIKFSALLLISFLILSTISFAGSGDEAERLWELGEKAYDAGRYSEAHAYYEKSLSKCAGDLECVAANSNGIGAVYEALDDDERAFKYYKDALTAARKINNRDLIATNLFNVGAIYNQTFNQYEKALTLFEESSRIFRELKDRESLAIVLFNRGKTLNSLGRYENALSVFNESLEMNRKLNNQAGIAGNLNMIGSVYANLGQNDKSLPSYQEALRINRRLNIPEGIATTLRHIGDAYCDLHKHDKALSYYQNALDIQRKHNLRLDMAVTLTNMGAFCYDINQYDKAISYYEESLNIGKKINNSAIIAVNLGNIGSIYARLGKSDKALSYYKQSLNLEQRLNRQQKIAITLNNIGMEYFRLGQYERALDYLNKALKIERRLNNPHNIAARLNNIGAVYLRQKRYGEAEKVFLERKDTGKRIAKTRLIHAGLAEVYLETKRYNNALMLLKKLPPTWRDSRKRRMEYHTQYGQALKGKGILRESSQELFKAVLIVEEIRGEVSERSGFFAGGGYISRLTPHRELVAVLSEMALNGEKMDDSFRTYGKDTASAAFYFSEMTKARTLLEAMAASAKKSQSVKIPQYLKEKEQSLLNQLASTDRQWEDAYKKGEDALNRLKRRKRILTDELDNLIKELRQKYPGYAALHYPKSVSPEDLPLKKDEVLLEYAIGEDAGYLFVVRKGGVKRLVKIPVTKKRLEEKIKSFIEPMNTKEYEKFSVKEAKALYDLLLSEAVKDIHENEKIIIVPDGILGLLPFEALVIKEGKDEKDTLYAGDRHAISYYQSASVLSIQRSLKYINPEKTLFALGNPVYSDKDPRYLAWKKREEEPAIANSKKYAFRGLAIKAKWGKTTEEGIGNKVEFPPLPETEIEVKEIAKIMGVSPEPPDILLSVLANETEVRKADLKEYRYIHFATHASLPGMVQGINEPFILLSQVENYGSDDGFLTLSDVLDLKLNADMVALSACVTGVGKEVEGEGVVNLARAFQYAGAKAVVVSLWEVASEPAVEYMKIFYGHLKAGRDRSEALKFARNEIKAKYPNPFFWAVFILHGEG